MNKAFSIEPANSVLNTLEMGILLRSLDGHTVRCSVFERKEFMKPLQKKGLQSKSANSKRKRRNSFFCELSQMDVDGDK